MRWTLRNFNPLPSHEGRHGRGGGRGASPRISIHSPHTRGDITDSSYVTTAALFQSAPLMRGETGTTTLLDILEGISIHSPHTRGDRTSASPRWRTSYFNPLPSYEGRLSTSAMAQARGHFNPLPSHEGRPIVTPPFSSLFSFNPLPSHEGRQHKPPKIHPDLRQLTQQNHDTPLFGALQAPFCGAKPDIRGAKPTEKP